MRNNLCPKFFLFLVFFECLNHVRSESSQEESNPKHIDCQQRSTLGSEYAGEANTTVDRIPCQKWSDTQPHDHPFTHVGDHNFCRNPDGDSNGVWCITTDSEVMFQYCSLPFCPPLMALDFSMDNDQEPDENNSYTHASLQKENLPPSFTICTAFMVEAWNEYQDARLFVMRDDKRKVWHWVKIFAAKTYTKFTFLFEDSPEFSNRSEGLFYPLPGWHKVREPGNRVPR